MSNVIAMPDRIGPDRGGPNRLGKDESQKAGIRDRRYAIRYPFAADADLIDLESGTHTSGVTSDISLGGCFICTSKPLHLRARVRMTLSYKGKALEALVMVRIVKPRIGMGIEFIDLAPADLEILKRWIDQLRSK